MAINRHTLRLVDGMRVSVDSTVDRAVADLVAGWGRAWNELANEWDLALADLAAASTDGKWPSRRQVQRAKRAQDALALTRDALEQLSTDFGVRVLQDVPTLTKDAALWEARLIASQMPTHAGGTASLEATFNRVDAAALDAIVERTTDRVHALSRPLSAQSEQAMKSVLIRGIALGDNPRTAARTMVDRMRGGFDGGLYRATVIARTEMLDAHRAAAFGQDQANAETLTGWTWLAQLDKRTCPSCWAMHGSEHPLLEPGPEDHQQGRCARCPRTKSWADLGFKGLDEPADLLPDARATFDALPDEQQTAIMGASRLKLLQGGQVSWGDLAVKRSTDGWRDSWAPRSTHDLLRLANAS